MNEGAYHDPSAEDEYLWQQKAHYDDGIPELPQLSEESESDLERIRLLITVWQAGDDQSEAIKALMFDYGMEMIEITNWVDQMDEIAKAAKESK